MAVFEYEAMTLGGKAMTGTIESDTTDAATAQLGSMGLNVQTVRKLALLRPRTKIGRSEFLLFNQQLASITRSGLPLERALRELAADVESSSMRKLLSEIADELEGGASIEQVFERRRESLPPLYSHILRAGLKSGRLGEMLTSLNRHLEMASHTRRILFEAMTYPVVILVLAAGVLTFLFRVLVPQFGMMYGDMQADGAVALPALTRAFLAMSAHVGTVWAILGVAVGAVLILHVTLGQTVGGRRFVETIKMHLPVLGRLYHLSVLARLADGMATLVGAGMDLPGSLRLASAATGSELMRTQCEVIAGEIERGASLPETQGFCRYLPGLFIYSMHHGAQRNELPDNLYGLSDMYVRQVAVRQSRLQAILMPVLLLVVGTVVGLAIVSLFLPMVNILQMMQKT